MFRQYLWTIRWRNGYTTTLPLEILTQKNSVADSNYSIEIEFYSKKNKIAYELPFGDLRVTCVLHL